MFLYGAVAVVLVVLLKITQRAFIFALLYLCARVSVLLLLFDFECKIIVGQQL